MANFRYLFEAIGPEIRQYFIQSDTEERPFSREQRNIVYQRAKNTLDKRPFGSQLNMYEEGFEWMSHSLAPTRLNTSDFRITVGKNCAKPYSASVFNISALSFGSLSANAILSLNAGARKGHFYHDTGEGSVSRYHRQPGGDLVWEIDSGYFGCRNKDIAIVAAGKINWEFNTARTLALGATWCNSGRGYMFALDCIQAMNCHTGRCPSGVTTQDPRRGEKIDVPLKSERVYNFHKIPWKPCWKAKPA